MIKKMSYRELTWYLIGWIIILINFFIQIFIVTESWMVVFLLPALIIFGIGYIKSIRGTW